MRRTEEQHKEILRLRACFLKQRQSLSLVSKLRLSQMRIKTAYMHYDGMIYVSFSGGVDSTVLLHITRQLFSDVPVVFIDTGLEYPENREFVKTIENVEWLRPKMSFKTVIEKYGYPVISKDVAQKIEELRITKSEKLRKIRLHGGKNGIGKLSECWKYLVDAPFKISDKCCDMLKKQPAKRYEKQTGQIPLIGVMTDDSRNRMSEYLSNGGCNMFDLKYPKSEPLAFWTKQDIWAYIKEFRLSYSKAYDMGYTFTGCMFCCFGLQREKSDLFAKNRFELMRETHPKQYQYCMDVLGLDEVLNYLKLNH